MLDMGLLSDAAVNAVLSNALIMFSNGETLYLASPAVERFLPADSRWLRVRCGPEDGEGDPDCQVEFIPFDDLANAWKYIFDIRWDSVMILPGSNIAVEFWPAFSPCNTWNQRGYTINEVSDLGLVELSSGYIHWFPAQLEWAEGDDSFTVALGLRWRLVQDIFINYPEEHAAAQAWEAQLAFDADQYNAQGE
jgi:hypothetical protein